MWLTRPDWQQCGLAKASLSQQDRYVYPSPYTWMPAPVGERETERWGPGEALRTIQGRGSHVMALPTTSLHDHICPWLDPASNPPWLSSALRTTSSTSAWHQGALMACLLATCPGSSPSPAPRGSLSFTIWDDRMERINCTGNQAGTPLTTSTGVYAPYMRAGWLSH